MREYKFIKITIIGERNLLFPQLKMFVENYKPWHMYTFLTDTDRYRDR